MRFRSALVEQHPRRMRPRRQEIHAGHVSISPDRHDAMAVEMLSDEQVEAPRNGEAVREHHSGTEARMVLDEARLPRMGEFLQRAARKAKAGSCCGSKLLHRSSCMNESVDGET